MDYQSGVITPTMWWGCKKKTNQKKTQCRDFGENPETDELGGVSGGKEIGEKCHWRKSICYCRHRTQTVLLKPHQHNPFSKGHFQLCIQLCALLPGMLLHQQGKANKVFKNVNGKPNLPAKGSPQTCPAAREKERRELGRTWCQPNQSLLRDNCSFP